MPTQQQIDDAIATLSQVRPPYLKSYENFVPGKDSVQYSGQWWDGDEINRALQTFIKGTWITAGDQVAKFQDAFAKKYNVKYAHMVNSGSSANLVMISAVKNILVGKTAMRLLCLQLAFQPRLLLWYRTISSLSLLTSS